MKDFKEILVLLKVVQTVSNDTRRKNGLNRLGKGYFKAHRLNPWNPLSYIIAILTVPYVFVMYGCVGLSEKWINPFKWY